MLRMIVTSILLLSQGAPAVSQTALAHLAAGAELMRSERYQEAEKEFKQPLTQNDKLDEARLNLAICLF